MVHPVGFRIVCALAVLAAPAADAAAANVAWTNLVNAVASGNTLQQSGCDGCTGGGTSTQTIDSGDGYVEFTVTELAGYRAAGLSHGNSDASRADIDFAVHLSGNGVAEVRENGSYRWDVPYAVGDVFRVAVTAGHVSYSRNGAVFYTSIATPVYPLLLDASVGSVGSKISQAVIASSTSGGDTTPPVRSNGQPAGSLASGTTSTTISLTTSETATCRYGTTPGIAYASLPSAFTTGNGVSHSASVSGLSDGGSYNYYVKCRDSAGNANPDDYVISFSVGSPSGLPPGFEQSLIASGLTAPTAMVFAPDGRLFVAEQQGRVRVIKQGVLLQTPFVTLSANSSYEQGLLGIELDPNFASNGYVYVFYTYLASGKDRVSRFTARSSNPDTADPASERVELDNILQTVGYHDGGALHFGLDAKLYVSVGDGNVESNVQSLSNFNGKLLRIDPATYPNVIPPDNPFVNTSGARGEIWARGFRNPFTFAVQPGTGKIHVNDVGGYQWEEVDVLSKGGNYGWPSCEGVCSTPGFINPIYAYSHGTSQASITGGAFYQANQFPSSYVGSYFFGDYALGFIRRLTPSNSAVEFAPMVNSPVDLDVGPDGRLYYLSIGDGAVYAIRYAGSGNRSPIAAASATPTSGQPPLQVSFDGSGSSDPDGDALTYAWQFGDGASATGVQVSHSYNTAGPYQAVLTVSDGHGGTASDTVTISVGSPPVGTITQPVTGTHYNAGQTISYAGTGTDTEDGTLPASAFSWTIVFHHLEHTHPFLGPITGVRSGSFTIPNTGESSAEVFYRIELTVTDASGLTSTTTRDVLPNTSTITLATQPTGLQLTLDSQPLTAPQSILGVVGMIRALGAPSPQSLGGQQYQFASWSDGGAATHNITTPATNTTYTATYQAAAGGAQAVVWTNFAYAAASGNTLQQTGCCRGGAVSTQSIASGDGFVEFKVAEFATQRAGGLSHGDTDTSLADIDFAIQLNGSGSAEVREKGVYRGESPYAAGDVFRIGVVSGRVNYSRNGTLFYRSATLPTYPLLMDTSLGSAGATIANAVIYLP